MIRAYFYIPTRNDQNSSYYSSRGSAPDLLGPLIEELKGALMIRVASFLYNN